MPLFWNISVMCSSNWIAGPKLWTTTEKRWESTQITSAFARSWKSNFIVMPTEKISIVIPVYNECESLPDLLQEVTTVLEDRFDYEIQVVDDGSTDGSFELAKEQAGENGRIEVTRFLRNYGKSAALAAGFRRASGDYVVTMDADLQDDPSEIPGLVDELKKGYDLVSGWKKGAQGSCVKKTAIETVQFHDPPADRYPDSRF